MRDVLSLSSNCMYIYMLFFWHERQDKPVSHHGRVVFQVSVFYKHCFDFFAQCPAKVPVLHFSSHEYDGNLDLVLFRQKFAGMLELYFKVMLGNTGADAHFL